MSEKKEKAMDRKFLEKVLHEMKTSPDYTMEDLLKIQNALLVLSGYGLVDMDLFLEVSKYIAQKGEANAKAKG
jgi:hypothetical protein